MPTRHVRTALVVVAMGFAATHLQNVVQDALPIVTQKLSADNMASLDNRIVRLTCAAPNLGRQNYTPDVAGDARFTDDEPVSVVLLMISARSLLAASRVLVAVETFQSHRAQELELENALLATTSPGQQRESVKA